MIWDEISRKYFDSLKQTLISASLFNPLDYRCDYFLYLAAYDNTISMVLVQDDDDVNEHVVYYLSQTIIDIETRYAHVEKLSLAVVHAIQRFFHYIFLWKTIVISNCKPMTYILTH